MLEWQRKHRRQYVNLIPCPWDPHPLLLISQAKCPDCHLIENLHTSLLSLNTSLHFFFAFFSNVPISGKILLSILSLSQDKLFYYFAGIFFQNQITFPGIHNAITFFHGTFSSLYKLKKTCLLLVFDDLAYIIFQYL